MITILADKHLYEIEKFIPDDTNLTLFDSNDELKQIPDGTDALLIRTVTPITPQTFPSLPQSLRFVGTGSAGTDHVDLDYLRANDIAFADAAGCNARSVAEYVAVALLLWAEQFDVDLANITVGIVGVGHAGREVAQILSDLMVDTVCYDPPRAEREEGFTSASLQDLLDCEVLTFHTPLTKQTDYPTRHWLDEEKLSGRSYSLIINAARGGVIDEWALREAFDAGTVDHFILDVWENEPNFHDATARRAFIKTPHIAGYSVQAKQRASQMMADALCDHFALDHDSPAVGNTAHPKNPPKKFWSLADALTYFHPIEDYKTRFMMLIGRSSEDKINGFNRIRTGHPLRDEFAYLNVPHKLKEHHPRLVALGLS